MVFYRLSYLSVLVFPYITVGLSKYLFIFLPLYLLCADLRLCAFPTPDHQLPLLQTTALLP